MKLTGNEKLTKTLTFLVNKRTRIRRYIVRVNSSVLSRKLLVMQGQDYKKFGN